MGNWIFREEDHGNGPRQVNKECRSVEPTKRAKGKGKVVSNHSGHNLEKLCGIVDERVPKNQTIVAHEISKENEKAKNSGGVCMDGFGLHMQQNVIPVNTSLDPTKHQAVMILDSPTQASCGHERLNGFDPDDDLMLDANQTSRRLNPSPEDPLARWRSDGDPSVDDGTMDEEACLGTTVPSSI
ncbi:OLC1v1009123C1 [Oldenlandia corymbosa var. corymbosa]|uniref:OLC1v1009123C1 n=1 Tax=Oldenlandia corymbosa var. corymbosa TaxID=529605 RepID=A0AAV1DN81_OLDCO|nr:OLC1v1009123C1 [Oldenlandia corymbosa var. corymbosa]